MENEDTDKQKAETLEPNVTTQPPLYDDEEMELSNE
jgi:hypothetical protein